jgi:hypothetical protein
LRASPYLLVNGDLIVARVYATNVIGTSTASPSNTAGVLIGSAPITALTLTRDATSTTSSLVIDWTALANPDDGYSAITSYNIYEYNDIQYVLYTSVSNPSTLTYTVNHAVTAGQYYQYKVTAVNFFGEGPQSSSIGI